MMTELQREAITVLAEVWALSPDVRLGQLFAHLGFLSEAHLDRSLGYLDDDEMLSILYRHREELRSRLPHQQNGLQAPVADAPSTSLPSQPMLPR